MVSQVESLLSIPLDSLALQVLELAQYSDILQYLGWENKKQVAMELLKAVIKAGAPLTTQDSVEKLFTIIEPLLKDQDGAGPGAAEDDPSDPNAAETVQAFEAEQILVARLVHLMSHEDSDELFVIYRRAKVHFQNVCAVPRVLPAAGSA